MEEKNKLIETVEDKQKRNQREIVRMEQLLEKRDNDIIRQKDFIKEHQNKITELEEKTSKLQLENDKLSQEV